jgi:hypothetical protein
MVQKGVKMNFGKSDGLTPITGRKDIIQSLIDTFQLQSYLEIGVQTSDNFNSIRCNRKVGVDPVISPDIKYDGEVHGVTSDSFFQSCSETFDIVFVDGLHLCEQVAADILNALQRLRRPGFIVLHDCLPHCRQATIRNKIRGNWTGDVYRAVLWFRHNFPDIPYMTLDVDWGCGVIYVPPGKAASSFARKKLRSVLWYRLIGYTLYRMHYQNRMQIKPPGELSRFMQDIQNGIYNRQPTPD